MIIFCGYKPNHKNEIRDQTRELYPRNSSFLIVQNIIRIIYFIDFW